MFKPEFVEYLKSKDNPRYILSEGENAPVFEKRKLNDNINMIYYASAPSTPLSNINLRPCFLADNNGNILFVLDNTMAETLLKDHCTALPSEKGVYVNFNKTGFKSFIDKVKEAAFEELNKKSKNFLVPENFNVYLQNVQENIAFKGNFDVVPNFTLSYTPDIDLNFVNDYYFDNEKLFKKSVKDAIEINAERFAKYVNFKNAYDSILEDYKKNDNLKFKEALLNILCGKYQNITLEYECPNGKILEKKCAKGKNYSLRRLKEDIFEDNAFFNIPVYAIKKVKWSRSIIFDAKDFNVSYSRQQLEDDFLNLNDVSNFPEEYFADKGFVQKALKRSAANLNYVDQNLLDDEDFVMFLLRNKVVAYVTILNFLPEELSKNVAFHQKALEEFQDLIIENSHQGLIVGKLNPELFNNNDFVKSLIKYNLFCPEAMEKIPVAFLDEIGKIELEEKFYAGIPSHLIKADKLELLESVYTDKAIAKQLSRFNLEHMDREKLFKYYFNEYSDINCLFECENSRSLISMFIDDEFSIYRLSKKIPNRTIAKKFLQELGIDPDSDFDKIMPFCSFNPVFFKLLDKEHQLDFIESAMSGIEKVFVKSSRREIYIDTDYLTFSITSYPYSRGSIYQKIDEDLTEDTIHTTDYDDDSLADSVFKYVAPFVQENYEDAPQEFYDCSHLVEFIWLEEDKKEENKEVEEER